MRTLHIVGKAREGMTTGQRGRVMQGTTQAKARLGAFGAMAVGIALVVCLASLAGCGSDKVQAGNDAKNAALTVDGSMSRWDIVRIGSQWF